MVEDTTLAFWAVFGFWFALLLAGSFVQWRFYRGLHNQYPATWELLGQPTMIKDRTLAATWETIKKLRDREYEKSSERGAVPFCESYRSPFLVLYYANCAAIVPVFTSPIWVNLLFR